MRAISRRARIREASGHLRPGFPRARWQDLLVQARGDQRRDDGVRPRSAVLHRHERKVQGARPLPLNTATLKPQESQIQIRGAHSVADPRLTTPPPSPIYRLFARSSRLKGTSRAGTASSAPSTRSTASSFPSAGSPSGDRPDKTSSNCSPRMKCSWAYPRTRRCARVCVHSRVTT